MSHALVYCLRHIPDGAERSLEGTDLTPRYRYGFDGRCEITGELEVVVSHQQSILDAYRASGFGGRLVLLSDNGILPASASLPPRSVLMAMTAKALSEKYGIPVTKKADMIERIING